MATIINFQLQDCITLANVHHAQKDITVSLVERHQKQANVKRATSVSEVQSVNSKKSVRLENIVQLAPMYPRTVLLAPSLTPLACGKKNSVPIAHMDHIVLKVD